MSPPLHRPHSHLQPRIDRFTFQCQNAEDALVDSAKRFVAGECGTSRPRQAAELSVPARRPPALRRVFEGGPEHRQRAGRRGLQNLIGHRMNANAARWRVRRANRMTGLCKPGLQRPMGSLLANRLKPNEYQNATTRPTPADIVGSIQPDYWRQQFFTIRELLRNSATLRRVELPTLFSSFAFH